MRKNLQIALSEKQGMSFKMVWACSENAQLSPCMSCQTLQVQGTKREGRLEALVEIVTCEDFEQQSMCEQSVY